ncbi:MULTISPECIES: LysR family transcriptional regulator [unclassified Azospirillum]|uniref:LysR family transcriptional regulator n=1 Tax=unclassified Azospirillum TaxID=2630922 RepID=UPI000B6BC065|nr:MULTISPECIES: LysR family transcriptional regulator [unclassified Azospirillum]SNS96871.1 DNA-binding transcriptional regulator, LysR family [Azospirillum sp. RU38E]SNT13468.1 DNA-binding transcriptional regulator, LysR family [Azospirillum sp. RU37A]
MRLRVLRHFAVVAETLNFHRAAEKVNLSQQAISKSIIQLESQLGLRLMDRDRQSVVLTEQGKYLLPYVQEVLAAARRLDDAVASAGDVRTGSLSIGATPTFLESVVPEALNAFQQRYPTTPIKVERGDFAYLCTLLMRGDIDLFYSTSPAENSAHLVRKITVGQDRNVIVVRSGHPLASKQSVAFDDLAGYPQIATLNYPRGAAYIERLAAAATMRVPRPALTVESTHLSLERVAGSDSWWVAPHIMVRSRLNSGGIAMLPVDPPDTPWDLIMVSRRDYSPALKMMDFQTVMRSCLMSSSD